MKSVLMVARAHEVCCDGRGRARARVRVRVCVGKEGIEGVNGGPPPGHNHPVPCGTASPTPPTHQVSIDSAYASLVISVCVIVGFATSLDAGVK